MALQKLSISPAKSMLAGEKRAYSRPQLILALFGPWVPVLAPAHDAEMAKLALSGQGANASIPTLPALEKTTAAHEVALKTSSACRP